MTTATFTSGTAPGALPLVGHGLRLRGQLFEFLESLPHHGDVVEIKLGTQPAYVVCHPDLVRQVLIDDRTFEKGGPQIEKLRELIGWGLATSPHDSHRRQRRLVQPAFQKERMATYADIIGEEIDATSHSWTDGLTTDVQRDMYRFSVRTTVRTLFAADMSVERVDELRRCIDTAFEGVYKRVLAPLGLKEKLPLPSNRRYTTALATIVSMLDEVIEQNLAAPEDSGDMLSGLTAARHNGDKLSAQELRDSGLTVLIGGSDTTSSLLTWTLHLLGQHPDIARRVQEESDEILAGRTATWDDMARLPYMNRVVMESLRLYPPVPLLTRETTRDTELGGRRIPAGATVIYSAYLMHRRPELFDDPERFDPDRWAEGAATPCRGAYVPFGLGARQCVGNDFATMRGVLALSTFLGRWNFKPAPNAPVRLAPTSTVIHPVRLMMELRAR
ncbi:cytochrome P450 [Streptomyces sp. DSM 110735]|uniref:cytochrome P450 n=1 Tax=Streptomyces sp. DSM 110735 TaxID=2775031 RepID=UPI0018F45EA0|nr:cytochrome P450 [Streptomyces sp. DSM 110735]MBJ7903860.1 cytochrome P450 [Streptomyces sp. DSM 110735]